ncbi:type II secretion system F family protein [Ensifer sp. ENS07]|jgi:tight adherence protein B|uniref:Type II secretion system F family protein n=1 Tax=Ensifer adhaerens TaxID=106592 RepID=A0A9Q8Y8R2_ENSAD|nr:MULTISPECIES: type II secretion system F family protein [Ensifer]KSV64230.1 pilus assembly protein [Sinorhizobium sp. GW3]MBD9492327.1 type II secretion system F family protein [Ensifer sp. ENS01]MBD9519706.1 type II secretion system F family protein [Ensifer sp. ENS02]MBD9592736.1 type II secretion system F family protein [Ensifer sp. ENS05]MBD9637608.1 type II secretion system F family protein [Ensifer sp. ENS07]
MFGIDITVLALAALVAISAAALAYGLLFSRIESEKKAEGRVRKISVAETDRAKMKAARDRVSELSKRRKSVQDSLKELEKKQQERSAKATPSMKVRLTQADLSISIGRFYLFSALFGFFAFLVVLILGAGLPIAVGFGMIAGLGLPRWFIGYLVKRRCKKFLEEFPNALEVMVRSIKSGLPLNDALRLIAADGQEPVKTEFRRVVESQQVGLSVTEACARMVNSIPLPEVNFFAIVIAIQAQAGGNLSEALGNLSRVLRERRKMRAKVSAMSMEAKASACIIGALPFIVTLLVYLTSPAYMMVLFTDPRGHLIIGAGLFWMSIGIWVMRNMINFDI